MPTLHEMNRRMTVIAEALEILSAGITRWSDYCPCSCQGCADFLNALDAFSNHILSNYKTPNQKGKRGK